MREYIRTDRNGTKYYKATCKCDKCGGTGTYVWGAVINGRPQYAGVCFKCDGAGVVSRVEKEYTPEHEEKLQAQREKRRLQRVAKYEAEEQKREEERKAREERQAKREAEWAEQRAKSQYVGNVGDKVDGIFTIDFEATYEVPSFRGYGTKEMTIKDIAELCKVSQGAAGGWMSGQICPDTEYIRKICNFFSIPFEEGKREFEKANLAWKKEFGKKEIMSVGSFERHKKAEPKKEEPVKEQKAEQKAEPNPNPKTDVFALCYGILNYENFSKFIRLMAELEYDDALELIYGKVDYAQFIKIQSELKGGN